MKAYVIMFLNRLPETDSWHVFLDSRPEIRNWMQTGYITVIVSAENLAYLLTLFRAALGELFFIMTDTTPEHLAGNLPENLDEFIRGPVDSGFWEKKLLNY